MIIDEYLDYTKTYKEKYGDKCIVLMQVGSFYELYAINDGTSEAIYTIADICNIQISRKNKSIKEVSISNPLMAGFPLYTIKKFTNILLSHNYTIVMVEQVTDPPNPQRKVTDILSPGMNINVTNNKKNNYMMVVYYEFIGELLVAGIAAIDLSTGKCLLYEAGSSKSDPEFANDEVFRILTTYNPCELIILSDKKYDEAKKGYVLKNLNLTNILVHLKWETFDFIKCMQKLAYQTAILERAFVKKNMLTIIESLNIERYEYGRIALCCILQFAYEHNVDIIKKLDIPEIINDNMYLSLEYNSTVQLNVLGLYPNDRPLLDILNRCITSFGSRMFRERLLKPIVDTDVLNKRYKEISYMLEGNRWQQVNKHLCHILDLERIKRKMMISKFHPQDWFGFNASLENAVAILETFYGYDTVAFKDMVSYYTGHIDIDEASKYNLGDIKGNIFIKGIYQEVDQYVDDFDEAYQKIVRINDKINKLDRLGDSTACKLDFTEKDGHHIIMTTRRFEAAKSKDPVLMRDFQILKGGSVSSSVKIVNQDIITASGVMEDRQNAIARSVGDYYKVFVLEFIEKYAETIDVLVKLIADIDVTCCNARNAYEFRYYCPHIVTGSDASFIEAENVRHPIIERIDDSIPYVGNEIKLDQSGMLLYGINAAGKSSLMKSVGLNIIMAQSGMYVPATNMQFSPYKHIFTRISGMDNIYKGMSSFTVEMTELRNILQRCDKYSLVLGDEICSGTEATSGLSIVAAGINTLSHKKSSFIFATHLHNLPDIDIVKMHILKGLIAVKHIHITIDENNRIVYERKIRDGSGSSTYGIEVCKSLDMPADFMKVAEQVRKEVEGLNSLMINPAASKYNKDVLMVACAVCNQPAEDTHHIEYQCKSDADGYFRDYHQNIKHNLVPLCKSCHKKEHSGEINIKGFKKTSDGVIIDVEDKDSINPVVREAGLSVEDCEKIRQYIHRGKCNWYIRSTKTNKFQKCSDEQKVVAKINRILKCTALEQLTEDLYNILYDPSL